MKYRESIQNVFRQCHVLNIERIVVPELWEKLFGIPEDVMIRVIVEECWRYSVNVDTYSPKKEDDGDVHTNANYKGVKEVVMAGRNIRQLNKMS